MRLTTLGFLSILLLAAGCGGTEPAPGERPDPAAPPARGVLPETLAADGPHSPGVLAGDTLYLSAQGSSRDGGIAAQTREAMERLGAVLQAAGMDYANLVKCHVFLASMDDYKGMNEVYGSFFSERVPARTTVEVAGLPGRAGVQIGCIGYRNLSAISVVRPPQGSLPAPLGPYSAAVWAGETLYLSGMGGQVPADRSLPEGLGDQVAQTLVNIGTTLKAAELSLGQVVASTVFMTERAEAGDLDVRYGAPFASSPQPPRTAVFVPRLPGGIKTEITFIASRAPGRTLVAPQHGGGARAASAGSTIYTRAELAPEAGDGFQEQFGGALRRLESTLQEAGAGWGDVAHMQVFLSNLADLAELDRLFRERFPSDPPARTVVQVVPGGAERVQVSLVAVRRN